MQIRGTSNIQSATQVNFSNKVQTVQNQSVATQLDTTDQVDISSEAQMLANMNDISDIRAERVAEIREQIAAGQYETADKLDSAMDRLLDEIA
jgi:negative regulator of flagellin synthesis FlgM